jgi:hypothetical protein
LLKNVESLFHCFSGHFFSCDFFFPEEPFLPEPDLEFLDFLLFFLERRLLGPSVASESTVMSSDEDEEDEDDDDSLLLRLSSDFRTCSGLLFLFDGVS